MTSESTQASQNKSATDESNDNKRDPAWKYSMQCDVLNKDKFQCNFCGKITNGGVYRVKEHLIGGRRNAKACTRVPKEVREEIKEYIERKKQVKEDQNFNLNITNMDSDEEDVSDDTNIQSKSSGILKQATRGPLDLLLRAHPEKVVQNRSGKQKKINENDHVRKELRARACAAFAKWMYDAGIPFNAVNYDSFPVAIEAIGQCGPGMKSPTFHEVRVPLLKNEVENTHKMFKEHEKEWEKVGCSLMCDGWTDGRSRVLINFLVNSPRGSLFLESVDASDYSKTGEKMYQLISQYVERIGPKNVVHVVTDSASNNKMAGRFLEAKYEHLFWTPCAAHCIDLILEDIYKISTIKDTFAKACRTNAYIYTHPTVLNMMRKFTKEKELLRPAKTRFATAFITLQRIHKQKNNLRKMFTSEEWNKSNYSRDPAGKKICSYILQPSFWNNTVYALKVAGPLVKVLRMVDSERKPSMGYMYEAMDRAKEAIESSFNKNVDKYKEIFRIIDERWNEQLHRPLHAAAYYLNPEFYYSNPAIETDEEVVSDFYKCLMKMVPDDTQQDKITEQLSLYKNTEGLFGLPVAKRHRTTKSPADWWACYGASAPDLQRFAMRILSLTTSASGCERNWSIFAHLHTKKRNRLQHKRLNDLVFVKYNRALKRRYDLRDTIDPLSLIDIDESNEWLTGQLDGENDTDNEFVFTEADGLNWSHVADASGANETRRSRSRTEPTSSLKRKRADLGSTSRSSFHLIDEDEVEEEEIEGNDLNTKFDEEFDDLNDLEDI